jgi:hypothetical protein
VPHAILHLCHFACASFFNLAQDKGQTELCVADPDQFLGVLMSTTNLTGRENFTKYAFWLGPVGPTDKENQVMMYKKYSFGYLHYLFETVRIRIWIRIKQSIRIKLKSRIRICIKRVLICPTDSQ